jgi:hypothetical protein
MPSQVCIRVPTNNHPDRELSRWLIWAAAEADKDRWSNADEVAISSIDITYNVWGPDRARNALVEEFLSSTATHLWMIDDDVVPPKSFGLLFHVNGYYHDYPIVSGLYYGYHKNLGRYPHVYTKGKEGFIPIANPVLKGEAPFFADAVGLGCCIFSREAFEGIGQNWFSCTPDPAHGMIGEDLSFFLKHPQLVRVVPSYHCQHIKDMAL